MADYDQGYKFYYETQHISVAKVSSDNDDPLTFHVNVMFFCNYINRDYDIHSGTFFQYNDPVHEIPINLKFRHVSEVPRARETIRETLSSWRLPRDELDMLSTHAVQEIVKLTSSWAETGGNVLNLDFKVTLEEDDDVEPMHEEDNESSLEPVDTVPISNDVDRVVIDIDGMNPEIQLFFTGLGLTIEPVENEPPSMVPATDESIKALNRRMTIDGSDDKSIKRAKTKVDETCVVCLEDLSEDSDVVCMPCEHEFHSGCIETWLKISHLCPICRYEMPTN